jgi:hypothetical protein
MTRLLILLTTVGIFISTSYCDVDNTVNSNLVSNRQILVLPPINIASNSTFKISRPLELEIMSLVERKRILHHHRRLHRQLQTSDQEMQVPKRQQKKIGDNETNVGFDVISAFNIEPTLKHKDTELKSNIKQNSSDNKYRTTNIHTTDGKKALDSNEGEDKDKKDKENKHEKSIIVEVYKENNNHNRNHSSFEVKEKDDTAIIEPSPTLSPAIANTIDNEINEKQTKDTSKYEDKTKNDLKIESDRIPTKRNYGKSKTGTSKNVKMNGKSTNNKKFNPNMIPPMNLKKAEKKAAILKSLANNAKKGNDSKSNDHSTSASHLSTSLDSKLQQPKKKQPQDHLKVSKNDKKRVENVTNLDVVEYPVKARTSSLPITFNADEKNKSTKMNHDRTKSKRNSINKSSRQQLRIR